MTVTSTILTLIIIAWVYVCVYSIVDRICKCVEHCVSIKKSNLVDMFKFSEPEKKGERDSWKRLSELLFPGHEWRTRALYNVCYD